MSSLRLMLVVLYKELVDNFRDRRALATALLMPLLGPIMVPLLLTFVADVQEKARAPVVPIEHRERAPELVAYLERSGIKLEPAPADPEQAVRDADVDLVLQIPEEYGPALRAGQPAPVVLIADPSRTAAGATIRRVEQVLQQYGAHLRMLRVVARGIDPLLLHPIAVQVHDVAPPEARGAMLLGLSLIHI